MYAADVLAMLSTMPLVPFTEMSDINTCGAN